MNYYGKLVTKQELLSLLKGLIVVKIREINSAIIDEEKIIFFEYDGAADKLQLLQEIDFAVPAGKTVAIISVEQYDEEGGSVKTIFVGTENKTAVDTTIYTLEDLFVRMV